MIDEQFWEDTAERWSVKEQKKQEFVLPPLTAAEEEDWPLEELDQELKDILDEIDG